RCDVACFFFQAEDGIRDLIVTGVQTCALPIYSPNGTALEDYDDFYASAQQLMYNPVVNQAFGFTAAERGPYGNTGLGDACLVARSEERRVGKECRCRGSGES